MSIRYFSSLGLLVSLLACRSASIGVEPEPVTPELPSSPTPVSVPLSSRTSWVIQPDLEIHKYSSTTSSILESADNGLPLRDSTSSTLDFSLTLLRRPRGIAYSARIERLSIRGGARVAPETGENRLPVSFTGRIESGLQTIDPSGSQFFNTADCSTEISSAIPAISRLIVTPPIQLQKGLTWTDSTSTTTCSGPVSVLLVTVRTYRVIGETGTGARQGVLIERQDKTLSSGEGTNGQHRVQLRTEGSGQTQLLVDTTTGSLIEATGTNTTTVTVTTSGRTQRFVQTSREHVFER